jgi:DnaJ homolog subfamily C member 28
MGDKDDDNKQTHWAEELGGAEEHRARMRSDWQNLIEDLIEDGRQKGVFDNLAGQGKPLDLSTNPYEGDRALANKLLRENDLKPAWIMQRDYIQEQVVRLRQQIERQWQHHARAYRLAGSPIQLDALVISWDDACLAWEAQMVAINKQIDTYNLKRPSERLEMFKLRLEEELTRAGARRYLKRLT